MDYLYLAGLIGDYLSLVLAIFFLFILLFSSRQYKIHSFILFLSSFFAFSVISSNTSQIARAVTIAEYIDDCAISILWDGVTALTLTMFLSFDKLAWKQAALLIFAVIVHTMLIYDLTIHSSFVSDLFYVWYDELIILIGLLQMAISKDGISNALGNIRQHLLRLSFYYWCYTKNLSSLKKAEVRS